MNLADLDRQYAQMQAEYGDPSIDAITNGGCTDSPDLAFVFMNPTGRNVAASKSWSGIKSPWLGTKNIWDLFRALNLVDQAVYAQIKSMKPADWTPEFASAVYGDLTSRKLYITNLAKCTQADARPLPDQVYQDYLELFHRELDIVRPKTTILFGNQVSSIVLGQKIAVSQVRKQPFDQDGRRYYSAYYPIGNGRFNIDKTIEDLRWVIDNN